MPPIVPEYLHTQLNRQYGPQLTERIIQGFANRRPVTLRVNTLRTTVQEVTAQLDAAAIAYQTVDWYPDALILPDVREDALRPLPLYENGSIYLQSLSAMVPALLMDVQPGETILDMAAAPGGKTTQMAALSGNTALITACEKNKIRAERLQFNLDRQGVKKASVMNQDARQLDDFFVFDKILLDAPCTGSGTILLTDDEPQRRMDEAWVKKTVATQSAMLQKALKLLRRGSTMIYSTCSIMAQENEGVVQKALAQYGAVLEPIDPALIASLPTLPTTIPGTLTICPTTLYEGFFVAKLRKK